MANNPRREQAERFGRKGEFWAKIFLVAKGFRTLDQRYKTRYGELDLIVKRGQMLVFVEVKARQNKQSLDVAFESVRQNRIINAAQYWISENPEHQNRTIRFDVIGLAPFRWPVHIVDAFQTN